MSWLYYLDLKLKWWQHVPFRVATYISKLARLKNLKWDDVDLILVYMMTFDRITMQLSQVVCKGWCDLTS